MNGVGRRKWNLLICLLALGALLSVAGSSGSAPSEADTGWRQFDVVSHEADETHPSNIDSPASNTADIDSGAKQSDSEVHGATDQRPAESVPLVSSDPSGPDSDGQRSNADADDTSDGEPSATTSVMDEVPASPDTEGRESSRGGSGSIEPPAVSNSEFTSRPRASLQPAAPPEPTLGDGQGHSQRVSEQSAQGTKGDGDGEERTEYTWRDGRRALTVILQDDLTIQTEATTKDAMAEAPRGAIVKSDDLRRGTKDESDGESLPVFKSQSGALMTLPGGILLALDPELSEKEVDTFFSDNGIKRASVEALDYIANGYYIETEPGFPSLNLANELAERDEVVISSPNWWTEVTVK